MREPSGDEIAWVKGLILSGKGVEYINTIEGFRFRIDLSKKTIYYRETSRKEGLDEIGQTIEYLGHKLEKDIKPPNKLVEHLTDVSVELMDAIEAKGNHFTLSLVYADDNNDEFGIMMEHNTDGHTFVMSGNEEGFWQVEFLAGEVSYRMPSSMSFDNPDLPFVARNLIDGARILVQNIQKNH